MSTGFVSLQGESDKTIKQVAEFLNVSHSSLGLTASSKGYLCGYVRMCNVESKTAYAMDSGWSSFWNIGTSQLVRKQQLSSALFILIVTTWGCVWQLKTLYNIPVYYFGDSDMHSFKVYNCCIQGNNRDPESSQFANDSIRYLGLRPSHALAMSLQQFKFEPEGKVYSPIPKEAFVEVGADECEMLVRMLEYPERYTFLKNYQRRGHHQRTTYSHWSFWRWCIRTRNSNVVL